MTSTMRQASPSLGTDSPAPATPTSTSSRALSRSGTRWPVSSASRETSTSSAGLELSRSMQPITSGPNTPTWYQTLALPPALTSLFSATGPPPPSTEGRGAAGEDAQARGSGSLDNDSRSRLEETAPSPTARPSQASSRADRARTQSAAPSSFHTALFQSDDESGRSEGQESSEIARVSLDLDGIDPDGSGTVGHGGASSRGRGPRIRLEVPNPQVRRAREDDALEEQETPVLTAKSGEVKKKVSIFSKVKQALAPVAASLPAPSSSRPRRSASLSSSTETSDSQRRSKRRYVKVHTKSSKVQAALGKTFLAQTIDTSAAFAPAPLSPILAASAQFTEEPDALPSTSSSLRPPLPHRRSSQSTPASLTVPSSPSSFRFPLRRASVGSQASSTATAPSIVSTSAGDRKGKGKALWNLAWSHNGRFLATAGQDHVIRIYRTIGAGPDILSPTIRQEKEPGESSSGGRAGTDVVEEQPYREYEDHSEGILSLSWSKNGFLLSSSMDKTVKLWHPDREACLATFPHPDFVTSIAFHPSDDRYFLSGCLDQRLRLWSIVERKVDKALLFPETITAVAYSVNGEMCAAGSFTGKVSFCSSQLEYQSSMRVKSARGKNSKGSKITNIQFVSYADKSDIESERLLVTSNDSRVRLFRMSDKGLEMKWKGHANESSQIGASLGEDGRWIICGSEDGQVYLWSAETESHTSTMADHCSHFQADSSVIACAVLAPVNTRILLAAAGDEIFSAMSSSSSASEDGSPLSPSTTRVEPATLSRFSTRATVPGQATFASAPIIAVSTMRGLIKIFRVDPGASLGAAQRSTESLGTSAGSVSNPKSRRGSEIEQRRASNASASSAGVGQASDAGRTATLGHGRRATIAS